ncbi:uncharacterized protein [Haliotis asinina]|uniref:uncharacterized protein n=1 Tax=Haliotis asinina TaxID=109174 RepID=UPI0035321BFA
MAGASPPPMGKAFKMARGIEVITYVGDITTLSRATGVVTGEGNEFKHESCITKALKAHSTEFAEKREELKRNARYFKSWSVHTTTLTASWPFSYVFHAVIKRPERTNRWVKKTGKLYKTIMKKAEKYDVKVLAIPLLGTGRGGASPQDAAQAAVGAVAKFENLHLETVFLVTMDSYIAEIINSQCEYERSPLSREKSLKRRKSFMKRLGCASSRTDDDDFGSYGKAPVDRRTGKYQNGDRNQRAYTEKYTHNSDDRPYITNEDMNQNPRSMDTSGKRARLWQENSHIEDQTDDRPGSGRNRTYPGKGDTQNANGHFDGEKDEASVHDHTEVVDTSMGQKGTKETREGNSHYKNSKDKIMNSSPFPRYNGSFVGESGHRSVDVAEVHSSHIPSQTVPSESRPDSPTMAQGTTTHDKCVLSYEGNRKARVDDDGRRQRPNQQTKTTMMTTVAGHTRSDERQRHTGRVNQGPSACPLTSIDMDNSTRQEMARKSATNGTHSGDNDGTTTQFVNGNNKNESSNDVKFLDMSLTRSCPICICPITDPKWLDKCGHVFCRECIDDSFKKFKPVCPSCNMVYGVLTGNQPDGTMDVAFSGEHLPGYETCGTISITYDLPGGIQGADHPNPGQPYKGTTRRAYLPDCREGRDVLRLLRKAFDRKLTFTIGRSATTGHENVVTWNDIHHKTKMEGGPTRFGYPDPDYLERVRCELASKGVTETKETTF